MGLRLRLIAMLVVVMMLAFVLLLVGVNFGLRNDVTALAQQRVDEGSAALGGALDARTEQIRSAILQGSAQSSLAAALKRHDRAALASVLSDIAVSSNLSFVVVTDIHGMVLAGSRAASGSLEHDPVVAAGTSAVQGGVQILDGPTLKALGATAHAPALAIAMASPVNIGGSALGVLYGGTIVDSTTNFVNDVSRFTGGATGLAISGAFVDTSLQTKEGAKEIGLAIAHGDVSATRAPVSGAEVLDNLEYYAKTAPLVDFEGRVVGTTWFGVPYAQFTSIVNNTLRQIVFWGIIGLLIALIAGSFVAARIGRAIVRRSDEVNESAQQLRVLVVSSEVSGDHVSRTREALEEISSLARRTDASPALAVLARQAVDDVVVMDTLTAELSTRMRDAATRVERLSAVAQELDALVAGARPSRN